jgi:hypothetical protein
LPDDPGLAQLRELQRNVAEALFRPLAPGDRMQTRWTDGRPMRKVAAEWIKPNDRLTSFERLQIYNRCYWFRVLDCLYDDFPGLRAILGYRKFQHLSTAYLARYPSASFTLRDLGSRLESFLEEEPHWIEPHGDLAMDMVRFEWAQVLAFDDPALAPIQIDALLDGNAATLRLGLQPYLTLLKTRYPVDRFALAVKAQDSDAITDQASNTVTEAPRPTRRRRPRLPEPKAVHLAVHRCDNMIYFKRLAPEEFTLLHALRAGSTLEEACGVALESWTGSPEEFSAKVRTWFETAASLGWFCDFNEAVLTAHSD